MKKPPIKPKVTPTAPAAAPAEGAIRSESALAVPFYTRAAAAKLPSVEDLLRQFGLKPTRALTLDERKSVLKGGPDQITVADNFAHIYRAQAKALGIEDKLSPDQLDAMVERVATLQPLAALFLEAAAVIGDQTRVASSDLESSLLRVRRRVDALSGESPEISRPWSSVEPYFARRYPGRGAAPVEESDEVFELVDPQSVPGAPDAVAAQSAVKKPAAKKTAKKTK